MLDDWARSILVKNKQPKSELRMRSEEHIWWMAGALNLMLTQVGEEVKKLGRQMSRADQASEMFTGWVKTKLYHVNLAEEGGDTMASVPLLTNAATKKKAAKKDPTLEGPPHPITKSATLNMFSQPSVWEMCLDIGWATDIFKNVITNTLAIHMYDPHSAHLTMALWLLIKMMLLIFCVTPAGLTDAEVWVNQNPVTDDEYNEATTHWHTMRVGNWNTANYTGLSMYQPQDWVAFNKLVLKKLVPLRHNSCGYEYDRPEVVRMTQDIFDIFARQYQGSLVNEAWHSKGGRRRVVFLPDRNAAGPGMDGHVGGHLRWSHPELRDEGWVRVTSLMEDVQMLVGLRALSKDLPELISKLIKDCNVSKSSNGHYPHVCTRLHDMVEYHGFKLAAIKKMVLNVRPVLKKVLALPSIDPKRISLEDALSQCPVLRDLVPHTCWTCRHAWEWAMGWDNAKGKRLKTTNSALGWGILCQRFKENVVEA
ncbi:hypothetical protein FRC07_008854 [Ceratobasidium sp. 392]|nr:hypothetical protein FRC07_008854 [Ceratobasidium sp. 392]